MSQPAGQRTREGSGEERSRQVNSKRKAPRQSRAELVCGGAVKISVDGAKLARERVQQMR